MPFVSDAILWLHQHITEILATVTGLLYIIYTIRENNLLWLFGIISSALYIWVFYHSGIYAYTGLYVYYVVIGFYGWYNWSVKSGKSTDKKRELHIHKATGIVLWSCMIITGILTLPLYIILHNYTDSDMALSDALLTSGGMVATWMLTQKIIEQWLFWIVIDLLSMSVMIYKELYPSAFLFLVYTLLAVKGYFEWKKEPGIK